jgi:RNA polymerase sigma-70 factor (ECF subfamily)
LKENEHHIIKGLRAGKERSYSLLFHTYYRSLTVFAVKYVGDLENAKEIVQDLFAHIYENRKTLMITTSLKSYLFRAVRNRCLNYLKSKNQERDRIQNMPFEEQSEDDIEALIQATELEERIYQIVEALPPRCREIFSLSRVKGLKNQEIASRLSISIRTVETQISNALQKLREELGEELIG